MWVEEGLSEFCTYVHTPVSGNSLLACSARSGVGSLFIATCPIGTKATPLGSRGVRFRDRAVSWRGVVSYCCVLVARWGLAEDIWLRGLMVNVGGEHE